jgi:Second Messenger Oligonucleotide or Dinucleotide Synthetase domain
VELPSDFKALASAIEPTSTHVTAAKAAHEKVREQLRADAEAKDAHRDTFLSGSYARSTAINDINDVDVICLLDIDPAITAPEVVIAWLHGILGKYYNETERQGRSIGVQGANGVWLDIVPSSPILTDDGPIRIPDREASEWVSSHPKAQLSAASDQNRATNGYFIPVVKLLKYWRDRLPRNACRPKSYVLETLVHRTIGYPTSHAVGVVTALEGIHRTYGAYRGTNIVPIIPDPGYSSVNVAKRWRGSEFDEFMAEVESAAGVARRALDEPDVGDSRKLWRRLFGPTFGA